jgi:hypothetical protein
MVKLEYKIIWKTQFIYDNLDSICVNNNSILVTAKNSGLIYEFDINTGNFLNKIDLNLKRPNGIAS